MLGQREMKLDDYLGIFRRRCWIILAGAVLGCSIAYGASRLLPKTFASQSVVLIEQQQVPDNMVRSVVTEDLMARLSAMQGEVLSRSRLEPIIERFGLYADERPVTDAVVDHLRHNVLITVVEDFSTLTSHKQPMWQRLLGSGTETPSVSPGILANARRSGPAFSGFTIKLTAERPSLAREVCSQITSMFIEENLRNREQTAEGTTDFLSSQLAEAKRKLDEQDAKLAAFKRRYMGALPDEQQTNLQLLASANSQLNATTDALSRAQQDRAYAAALLAQQVEALKEAPIGNNHQETEAELRRHLAQLQDQLAVLKTRYTGNHPDLIKVETDIEQVKKALAEQVDKKDPSAPAIEPPQIIQLRAQVRQDEETLHTQGEAQKRVERQIKLYESRVQLSPAVEQAYKEVTRDYKTALDFYNDLLKERDQSAMAIDLERQQHGERFRLLDPANLPDSPDFPNPVLFAAAGLGGGLALGLALVLLLEVRDKALRTERDIECILGLPTLAMIPSLDETRRAWSSAKRAKAGIRKPAATVMGLQDV